MLEIENYDSLKAIINRDYETFSGLMLERYFKRMLIESKEYTRIGSWWDRKGENEIDIVAENELNNEVVFFEIKRNKDNFNANLLNEKVKTFIRATGRYGDYTINQRLLSLNDLK
jgi:AAA+ ATPase superfamily predicted ATPase